MTRNKPPFKLLTGNFSYGMTMEPAEYWVFDNGEWEIQTLEGEQHAYYAYTIAGRSVQPFVRMRDVQSYREWQMENDIVPDQDEWWRESHLEHMRKRGNAPESEE